MSTPSDGLAEQLAAASRVRAAVSALNDAALAAAKLGLEVQFELQEPMFRNTVVAPTPALAVTVRKQV